MNITHPDILYAERTGEPPYRIPADDQKVECILCSEPCRTGLCRGCRSDPDTLDELCDRIEQLQMNVCYWKRKAQGNKAQEKKELEK